MVRLVVGVGTGWIVSVCPSVVTVCSPVKVEPGGSVRTTEDPSGSVNVSTFEVDTDGVENTLDAAVTGSTVNVEPDIVRVSSPVTEELAGRVRVTKDSPGSMSVCTIKGADPQGLVNVWELETVERDTVFEVEGLTGPLELVVVLETHVLGVLEDSLHDEAVDEKTVESVVHELLQVDVTVVQDEEPLVGTYWRTTGATGLEKEVPARAARLDRPIICFNAISAGRLQWPRRTMAKPRAAG
jgi:hypothetical protein